MIRIAATVKKGNIRRVEVSGHGGEKKGSDIVCAAVSAVTQTALLGLLHHGEEYVTYSRHDGVLSIETSDAENGLERNSFNAILTTMMLGLQAIEKEHPDRVGIELRES